MKILQKIKNQDYQIAVMKIYESLNQLIKLSDIQNISKFKTERRKKEILSTRLLLNKILPNTTILYNKYGAPCIENDNFISISHSIKFVAIIISKFRVGIDIEKITKKPLRLSSKFIANSEHFPLSEEKATLIWCCKEAIYKWHQKRKINFITDIKILSFSIKKEGKLIAKFKNQKLTLHYKKIDDHFLVYVCNKN
ncbi:MAG: hypothetical protein CMD14_05995 [Flavobacteriales bacterium]|mgnify:CR=1 FL=1|nr:hypothetical protein [Flavobacteriales bacterium]|tara:strand:- start:56 stop:643 length:588 start_codon:yes stop_codon:yes gene_type:complete